ncbi:MAG: ABC transporter permease [Planctomycetota bacterium]
MTGFGAFLKKEFQEMVKTWRIWVVPGIVLFFAITSPFIALAAPALGKSLAEYKPGVVVQIPPAEAVDAYLQHVKNLFNVLMVVVIACAGCVSGERKAGTAILVLTKPLARAGFILAKMISQQTLVLAAVAVGTALSVLITTLLFGESPIGAVVTAVALWLVVALFMIVVMTLLSVLFSSFGAACGVGLGVFLLLRILAIHPALARFSPAGLATAPSECLTGAEVHILWPVVTTILLATGLAAFAVRRFQRQEL